MKELLRRLLRWYMHGKYGVQSSLTGYWPLTSPAWYRRWKTWCWSIENRLYRWTGLHRQWRIESDLKLLNFVEDARAEGWRARLGPRV